MPTALSHSQHLLHSTWLVTTYLNTPATATVLLQYRQCRRLGPKDYIRPFTDAFRYTTILKPTLDFKGLFIALVKLLRCAIQNYQFRITDNQC
jgi:hypothetical protein